MRGIVALIVAVAGLAALPALAQTTPARIRGTVEQLDGKTLTVKSRDGQSLTLALADNFTVTALVKKTPADIKSSDFVASTGLKGADGKLHCVELRIFPAPVPAIEGQGPWDSMPEATMTNETVTGIVDAAGGQTVKVAYKGTESEFVIGPECQVFGYVAGDPALLKPGAAIFTVAQKSADGTLTASRITAEKDGIKPPM